MHDRETHSLLLLWVIGLATEPDSVCFDCCPRVSLVPASVMGVCYSRKPMLDGLVSALPPVDQSKVAAGLSPVYLHIYDLLVMNYSTSAMGVGVYHTGVQVSVRDWADFAPRRERAHLRQAESHGFALCVLVCSSPFSFHDEYCFSGHNQVDQSTRQEITGLRSFRPPTDTSWIEDAIYKVSRTQCTRPE